MRALTYQGIFSEIESEINTVTLFRLTDFKILFKHPN